MLLGALLVLLLLGGAAPAGAHAALRGSDPEDGGVVGSAPRRITLLPLEGTWTTKLTVRVSEVDQVSGIRQVGVAR